MLPTMDLAAVRQQFEENFRLRGETRRGGVHLARGQGSALAGERLARPAANGAVGRRHPRAVLVGDESARLRLPAARSRRGRHRTLHPRRRALAGVRRARQGGGDPRATALPPGGTRRDGRTANERTRPPRRRRSPGRPGSQLAARHRARLPSAHVRVPRGRTPAPPPAGAHGGHLLAGNLCRTPRPRLLDRPARRRGPPGRDDLRFARGRPGAGGSVLRRARRREITHAPGVHGTGGDACRRRDEFARGAADSRCLVQRHRLGACAGEVLRHAGQRRRARRPDVFFRRTRSPG